jgi:OTU domain-containing protein 3
MPKGRHRAQRHHKPATPRRQPPRKAKSRSTSSSNAAKIEEYMRSHGVIRRTIIGDGNCLFRAMADQLGHGEDRHREIRERVVKTILEDKEYFANFIDGDEVETVEDYCEEMAKDGNTPKNTLHGGFVFPFS